MPYILGTKNLCILSQEFLETVLHSKKAVSTAIVCTLPPLAYSSSS